MNKKLDIIVYGATGFTGGLCVKYLKENYLEMNDGKLGNTIQETFYTSNYHAMTELDGYFSIPLDCLAFDSGEHIITNDLGNVIGTWAIPYKTKLWIVHEAHTTFTTDFYDVDPDNGVNIEIIAPY